MAARPSTQPESIFACGGTQLPAFTTAPGARCAHAPEVQSWSRMRAKVQNGALLHRAARAHARHGQHHAARRQHGAGAYKALRMAQHRKAKARRFQLLQPLRAQGVVAKSRVGKRIFAHKLCISCARGQRQRRGIVQKGRFKLPGRGLCHGAAIAARPQN